MKTCFLFNPLTGEFISQYLAQESPEEPGEFLAPIHSTFVEPPAIDAGQVLVFADGEWTLQPDHRGETWYDAQGNPVLIETIGTPDAALSPLLPDAQQLAIAQTQQLALLAAAYAAAIQQPVTYLDTSFQADESSQIVLTKVLVVGAVASTWAKKVTASSARGEAGEMPWLTIVTSAGYSSVLTARLSISSCPVAGPVATTRIYFQSKRLIGKR